MTEKYVRVSTKLSVDGRTLKDLIIHLRHSN